MAQIVKGTRKKASYQLGYLASAGYNRDWLAGNRTLGSRRLLRHRLHIDFSASPTSEAQSGTVWRTLPKREFSFQRRDAAFRLVCAIERA